MVETGFRSSALPVSLWTSCSVTVLWVVGVQVMVNGLPAAIPVKAVLVKGFGWEPVVWAAATTARAPARRAEMKRMVTWVCCCGFGLVMKELSE